MKEPYNTLISAAILAPSGDNTQPWQFEIDERQSSITVRVDWTRDTSPMNAGQAMARMACGAALENIVRTAHHNGWHPKIVRLLPLGRGVTVQIDPKASCDARIEESIWQRATRRVRYDNKCISSEIARSLAGCETEGSGSPMVWITDRHRIRKLATQIAHCDSLMFGEPNFLRAFLKNVRFDLSSTETADHGLHLDTLGLSRLEKATLPLIGRLPNWMLRSRFSKSGFARKAKSLLRNSSGMWVLLTDESSAYNDFVLGRLMQRAWLQITAAGLAAQPMMSLPVLLGSVQFESTLSPKIARSVAMIHDRFRKLIGADRRFAVAAILRFGYSEQLPVRTGRRPIEDVTTWVSAPVEPSVPIS